MADTGPGMRKKASADELAALHPLERAAYRAFEFCASLRLAVLVMCWLAIEVIAGTLVESYVNAPAAKYMVYGSTRFNLCLGVLALNMASAALIRLPWKRRHTGFVITHIGVILMIFGSSLTLRENVDAQLQANKIETEGQPPESPWADRIFDLSREELEIAWFDADKGRWSETPERVPLELGPFTWGDKLLGFWPWRAGHVETHALENGDEVRIVKFFADADCAPTRVPAEDKALGSPAASIRLAFQTGEGDRDLYSGWSEFRPTPAERPLSENPGGFLGGALTTWSVGTMAEFEHFVRAAAPPPASVADPGLRGVLYAEPPNGAPPLRVDDLLEKPAALPDGGTLWVAEYFPDAVPGNPPGTLKKAGDEPKNPGLRLTLTRGGKNEALFVSADRGLQAQLPPAAWRYVPPGFEDDGNGVAIAADGAFARLGFAELRAGAALPGTPWAFKLKTLADAEANPEIKAEIAQALGLAGGNPVPASRIRGTLALLEVRRGDAPVTPALVFSDPYLNSLDAVRRKLPPGLLLTVCVPKRLGSLEVVRGPDGSFAFQAWGMSRRTAGGRIKLGEALPALPVPQAAGTLNLVVADYLENARPDYRLTPKPLEVGETGRRACVVEYKTREGVFRTALSRSPAGANGTVLQIGSRAVRLRFEVAAEQLPFRIRLMDFLEPKIPGTNQPAAFISVVDVDDRKGGEPVRNLISMNQPLRQTAELPATGLARMFSETLSRQYKVYQSSISHLRDGPVSGYTVGYDPGLAWKLWGGVAMSAGIVLMLTMRGVSRELMMFFGLATAVLGAAFAANQWSRDRQRELPPLPAAPAPPGPNKGVDQP